jgi:hypothetical protein
MRNDRTNNPAHLGREPNELEHSKSLHVPTVCFSIGLGKVSVCRAEHQQNRDTAILVGSSSEQLLIVYRPNRKTKHAIERNDVIVLFACTNRLTVLLGKGGHNTFELDDKLGIEIVRRRIIVSLFIVSELVDA